MTTTLPGTAVFDELESEIRTYCRRFPAVFTRAVGHRMWDEEGREFLDFLSGAGALNYGHNPSAVRQALVDYLLADGPVHGLDLHTGAKRRFLERFQEVVLGPRGLDYRVQFTGPTGTNAIESAFKVARRVTGRTDIVAFTGGFHGLSLGALAASATAFKRDAAGVPLGNVLRMPYEGFAGENVDTIDYLTRLLDDPGSGIGKPAAFVVETVQGEGGLAAASPAWLRRLAEVARERGILLIVDDIQAGCGRTGAFFSFEEAGITPDLVCLSKSISGYGLPMALVLVKPELDQLGPGEHSGTFRGNNLAFVSATAVLDHWADPAFVQRLAERVRALDGLLDGLALRFAELGCTPRGRGLIRGLAFTDPQLADRVSRAAFEAGLLVETSGARGQVLKIMPPIVLDEDELARGVALLADVIDAVARKEENR
ncbi:diaminobutyrate--2-oxoglutarate transaminase [Kitasatospora sp. NBC_01250]|uniref:diaminobutyrate--2-oxoglutarate transaminase n=1 Tax=unclassified Kitasatospora TaxID=2633591 RepID=UPI002E16497F|nr:MULTISPECIES: diaminobutyrate--2-oxoglutarate transaminase [unclassified Kitasatospora]WSJ71251.1 diaminobutyrate--2-oxoglutarate transaminase [Kitasatospora sp. NBC_01302]